MIYSIHPPFPLLVLLTSSLRFLHRSGPLTLLSRSPFLRLFLALISILFSPSIFIPYSITHILSSTSPHWELLNEPTLDYPFISPDYHIPIPRLTYLERSPFGIRYITVLLIQSSSSPFSPHHR
ncbi:unnamed protein product [Gordionus sp. m RMFG-2023]